MIAAALLALVVVIPADSNALRIRVAPGEELNVVVMGQGPAVVLIPGVFGSAYTYRQVTRALADEGYRAVVVELLGTGVSSRPKDGNYSLMAQARRVGAVLDTLGIGEATFVGHSVAASVAMRLDIDRPEMVMSIVSVEGGPTEEAATVGFRRLMRLAPALRMSGALRGLPALIRREMRQVSEHHDWITRELIVGYTRGLMADLGATMDGFQGMAKATEPLSLADNLHRVRAPVLLLISQKEHDSGPDADEIHLMTNRLPSFSVDTIAGTGYFIQEEQPGRIVDAIRQVTALSGN